MLKTNGVKYRQKKYKISKILATIRGNISCIYYREMKISKIKLQIFLLFDRIKKFVSELEITEVRFYHPFGTFKVRKKKTKNDDSSYIF